MIFVTGWYSAVHPRNKTRGVDHKSPTPMHLDRAFGVLIPSVFILSGGVFNDLLFSSRFFWKMNPELHVEVTWCTMSSFGKLAMLQKSG